MHLKVISYNCQSVRAHSEIISKLLCDCDILLLQETFLSDINSDVLDNINLDFSAAHTPAIRKIDQFYGRSSGGLAILWRKSYNMKIFPVCFNERCMGIRVEFGEISYLIINVYLNCDYGNHASLIEYKDNIAKLANFINTQSFDEVIIAGDFNCDPTKGRFFNELNMLISIFDLNLSSVNNLPSDTFTFINRNQVCGTSWLDHVLTSNSKIVENLTVLYGCTFEDHIPLKFCIVTPQIYPLIEDNLELYEASDDLKILWNKASELQIDEYTENLDCLSLNFMYNSVMCNKSNCNEEEHKLQLANQYKQILEYINLSSDHLPKKDKLKFHKVVGWNDHCKTLYSEARFAFLEWTKFGKIHFGELFENMKRTRLLFRKALRYCRENKSRLQREKFIKLFLHSDRSIFWSEIKKLNPSKRIHTIDGFSSHRHIVDVFSNKFGDFKEDQQGQQFEFSNKFCGIKEEERGQQFEALNMTQQNTEMLDQQILPLIDIDDSIKKLNEGQGHDSIYAKHLKLSGPVFRNMLKHLFLQFIRHGFLPNQMLRGEIRPIIKNNKASKSDSNNFRPIMNSSVFLKTFEYCLLPSLTKGLILSDLQMGFRNNSNCTNTVIILKELISNYNNEGSNVHCGFIDLSKAFDRVNHVILFNKLKLTNLSGQIINIVEYIRVFYGYAFIRSFIAFTGYYIALVSNADN